MVRFGKSSVYEKVDALYFVFENKGIGASPDPCHSMYAGSAANSEIEVKTISDYILSIKSSLIAYLSFHNYGQLWMSPYGW
jgi:hypothetical protein